MARPLATVWILDDLHFRRASFVSLLRPWAEQASVTLKPLESLDGFEPPLAGEVGKNDIHACILSVGSASLDDAAIWVAIETLVTAMLGHPVIIISEGVTKLQINEAIRHGVRGLIPMSMTPDVAIAALDFVLLGGSYFPHDTSLHAQSPSETFFGAGVKSPRLSSKPSGALPTNAAEGATMLPAFPDITRRQKEVLAALRAGHSNKEIARRLELSESTVKVHVKELLRKFGATSRTQIVLRAASLEAMGATL